MSSGSRRAAVMAHMIAFYPGGEESRTVARALIDGGASYIEIQFPFSDPSADGPVIQEGCRLALEAGFTLKSGFELVRETASLSAVPVFIMSYGNLVFSGGVDAFVERAKDAGARGLIIPDLTPGYDEGLYRAARTAGLDCVPVVAPSVTDERLERIGEERPAFVYAALRSGVTGNDTEVRESDEFLRRLEKLGSKIIAGFGIRSRAQVEELMDGVHAVVVGSEIIRRISSTRGAGLHILYNTVRHKVSELVSGYGEEGKTHTRRD